MDQSLENNIAKEINSKSTNSCYSKLKKGKQQFFSLLLGTRIAKLTNSSTFLLFFVSQVCALVDLNDLIMFYSFIFLLHFIFFLIFEYQLSYSQGNLIVLQRELYFMALCHCILHSF